MSNVVLHNHPFGKALQNFVDDFINEAPTAFKNDFRNVRKGFAPVNILEKEKEYEINIAAPGFEKSDFKISLDKNILTISAETKKEEEKKDNKFIRKEFHSRSFNRAFTIDDKVDPDKIEAKYVNGILIVSIQKKENIETASKDIQVL